MSILRNRGYYITNSDPNLDSNIKDGVTDGATLCYDETNENFYIFKDSETSGSKWVLQESDTELWSLNGSDIYYNGGNVGIGTSTPSEELEVVGNVEAEEFIGDLRGAVLFKAQAGEALSKGDVVYISGISGNTTVVSKADADDASKMPAFGIAATAASLNNPIDIYTVGTLTGLDTSGFTIGDELYVSSSAGELTATAPTGESSLIQKIAKVTRVDNSAGSIKISGAGRTNATPNLNEGRLFVGNSSNKSVADGTVYVDIANSKVGIGTTSPSEKLEIGGNIKATSFIKDSATSDDVLLGDGTTTSLSGISDGHSHSNKTVLDKFGEDGSGLPTYNGNLVDTTIAQRDVYDGLDSTDNTISLSANQGKILKDAQDLKVDGSGTANYISKWNDSNTLEDSVIYDDGTNVGIGTTSPDKKLDVAGDWILDGITGGHFENYTYGSQLDISELTSGGWARANRIATSDSDAYVFSGVLGDDTTLTRAYWTIGSSSDAIGYTYSNGIILLKNGDVGIGITSPSQKLHVSGNARVTGAYYDSNNSAGTSGQVLSSTATGTDWVSLSEISGVDGTGIANYVAKWSDGDTITNSIIYDNGTNVGIGTTSPVYKLDVHNGTVGSGIARFSGAGLDDMIFVTEDGYMAIDTRNTVTGLSFQMQGSDKVRILPSGNVGIGTTSPSEKLEVSGNALVTGTIEYQTQGGSATSLVGQDAAGKLTTDVSSILSTYALTSHNHNYILATDDRDVKPNATSVGSTIKGIQPFFTSLEGMTGSSGTNYQDLLVLDTYSDVTGGNANAITLDKSDGSMRIWNAVHSATSWGTPKRVWTDDDFAVAPTGINTGDQDLSGYLLNTTDTLTGDLTVSSKIYLGDGGNGYFYSDSDGRTAFTGGQFYIQSGVGTYYNYATNQYHGASSGDNHYFRGNELSGDNWSINASGNINAVEGVFTGNVGIGTTSPGVDLHILGGSAPSLKIEATDLSSPSITSHITLEGFDGRGKGIYFTDKTLPDKEIFVGTSYSGFNANFTIGYEDDGTGAAEYLAQSKFYIDLEDGNVGIGTTSPSEKLEVSGNIKLSETAATTDTDKFAVLDGGIIKYRTGAQVLSDIGGQSSITNPVTGTGTTNYVSKWTSTNTQSNSQIFDNGTSVGIGTTSPRSILETDGTISINDSQTTLTAGDTLAGIDIYTNEVSYNPTSGRANSPINRILPVAELVNADAFGMAFYTADQDVEAAEAMRISSEGNVGIGTTSPNAKLDVNGDVNGRSAVIEAISASKSNGAYTLEVDSSAHTSNLTAAGALKVDVNSGTALVVNGQGNVGIGTTSPGVTFDVVGKGRFTSSDDNIKLVGTGVGSSASPFLTYQDSALSNIGRIGFLSTGNNDLNIQNLTSDGKLELWTNSARRISILSDGKVGIGTTSPASPLHVYENNAITNSNGGITIEQDGTGDALVQFLLTGAQRYVMGVDNSDSDKFKISSSADLGSDNILTITDSGNVGIGTTSPEEKLEVDGTVLITNPGGNSINGFNMIRANYLTGESIVNIGSIRSSGNLALMKGLKPSTTVAGGYLSSVDNVTWDRSSLEIGSDLIFKTAPNDNTATDSIVTLTDRFIVKEDGDVGIGTSSPSATLDVVGDIEYSTEGGTAIKIVGKDATNKLTVTGVDSLVQTEVGNYINDRQFLAAIEADTTLASKYSLQFPTTIYDGYVTVSGTNDETLTLSDAGVYKITVDVVLDDGAVASDSYSFTVQNGLTTVHFSKQNFYEQTGQDKVALQFTCIVQLDDAVGYNLQIQNQALASAQILSGYAQIELLYLVP